MFRPQFSGLWNEEVSRWSSGPNHPLCEDSSSLISGLPGLGLVPSSLCSTLWPECSSSTGWAPPPGIEG